MTGITEHAAAFLTAAAAAVGVLAGWLRWIRPRWRHLRGEAIAARDQLLGRDEIVDSITGRQIAPPLPGVGVRLETQEHLLAEVVGAVRQLADTSQRLDDHEQRLERLERDAS